MTILLAREIPLRHSREGVIKDDHLKGNRATSKGSKKYGVTNPLGLNLKKRS